MKAGAIVGMFGALMVMVSCRHHPIEPYPENIPDPTPGETPCDPDSVYFNRDIFPIIQSNCAISGCHGDGSAEDGVDLTTYAFIVSTGEVVPFNPGDSKLYEVIVDSDPGDRMPPAPADALTPEQIALIAKWINQGAKNNECFDCQPELSSFSEAVFPTIENYCKGCHSGGAPSGGVSLTNYEEVKAQALSGALYGTVNYETGYVGMPYAQTKLSDCKITQIKNWIDEGVLDN